LQYLELIPNSEYNPGASSENKDTVDSRSSTSASNKGSSTGTNNKIKEALEGVQKRITNFHSRHASVIKTTVLVVMVMAYCAYFAYALYYEFGGEPSIRLLWVTMTVGVCFLICIIQDHFGDAIYEHLLKPIVDFVRRHWRLCKW
jgi:hypothetical protein